MESYYPFFSIIIPTYNRPEQLGACLDAITQLAYPSNRFEVVIIDDGGDVPLDEVIAAFRDRFAVSLGRQDHAGVATGRNTGATLAKGEYLVFTDDDCRPAPDWLKRLAARFNSANDCIIGGRTVNALRGNVYSTASQLLVSYLFLYYNVTPDEARFLNGSNLAVPADRFNACGGFDRAFYRIGAEEREFCDRWLQSGLRMVYAPEVMVYHFHSLGFSSFLRQHFKYGCGAFHFHRLRSMKSVQRMKVEPLSFYLNMLRYPFAAEKDRRTPLLALLLMVSQAANAMGFFWEKFNPAAGSPKT